MSEHSHSEAKVEMPDSGLHKIAQSINRFITPINNCFAYFGAGMLGLLVLMLMYSIIGRRFLGTPLKGSFELTELSLIVITFTVLAAECMGHEKMTVDVIITRFPRKAQNIIAPLIYFLVIFMLGVLCWQLVKQGLRVQGFHQTTRVLQIPIYPFYYLACFGVFTLLPIYLVRFLVSVEKVAKK